MASTAALFDKQQLRSRDDMLKLGQILNESMKEYLTKRGNDLTPDAREAIENSTVNVFRQIKQFIGYGEEGEEGGPPGSPLLPPLSPPPYDPEVAALEEKVDLTSKRIAKLRVEMQAAIEERVQKKIIDKLPTAELSLENIPDPDVGETRVDANKLKEALAGSAGKMPELKAKLEDVYSKLNKLIDSMDESRDLPPNTVERAVKRVHADDEQNIDDPTEEIANPALKTAVSTGRLSMRHPKATLPDDKDDINEEKQ